ncbi:hypothetical protein M3Y97_00685200 [Aphelenchoides bicaudatus]|nr:hypothetical protein M3Y97_00685200 [Aphelenchoides bicaudatus]
MGANSRKQPNPDSDSYKVQVELSLMSERLTALLKEKQQSEKNYEELLEKKDKLILELHRKLEEQRVKATTESNVLKADLEELRLRFDQAESEKQALSAENYALTSDLEKVRHEATELRSTCEVLAKNDHVSETAANTLQEFCSASSQMGNDQLKQATEYEQEEINDLVKASFPYVICHRAMRSEAETHKQRRKAVNYWGVVTDPKNRWNNHKSRNNFSDKTHEMLILRKWTDDTLPQGVFTHRSAALVDEHILGGFCKQFTPIEKAKSGNGNLEESDNKKLAKQQWRISELSLVLDDVLLNGKMKFENWQCPHCSAIYGLIKDLRSHISDKHLAADDPNKRTYKCSHADCVDLPPFQTQSASHTHNSNVHNKPLPCIECNVTRTEKKSMKKHLINEHDYEEMYAKEASGCRMTKTELKQLNQNKLIFACILRLLSTESEKTQTVTTQEVFDICERVSKKVKVESCPPEAIEIGLKMLNEQGALKVKKSKIRTVGNLEKKRLLLVVDNDLIEQVQKLDFQ